MYHGIELWHFSLICFPSLKQEMFRQGGQQFGDELQRHQLRPTQVYMDFVVGKSSILASILS